MNFRLAVLVVIIAAATLAQGDFTPAGAMGSRDESTRPRAVELPVPAGGPLWTYLTKTSPYKGYSLWPGKGKLYKGTEPHGALLTTYVNDTALAAINGKTGRLSPGSIIVKENYMQDETLAAVTVMYKVLAYNPEAGDWFWAKYDPDGKVLAEGTVGGCIGCHGTKKDNDYVMTAPLM